MHQTLLTGLLGMTLLTLSTWAAGPSSAPDALDSKSHQKTSGEGETRLSGVTAPDTTVLQLLDRGPMILHFWAEWCAPCRAEMVELREFHDGAYRELARRGVALVTINNDPSLDIARTATAELGLEHIEVFNDPHFLLNQRLADRHHALPMTYLIRRDGSPLRLALGALPWNADTFPDTVLRELKMLPGP